MKNLYIPGMNSSAEEYEKVKQLFKEEGLSLERLLENYLAISRMSKNDVIYTLVKKLDELSAYQDTTLICHSMGCNLGFLGARHPAVKKMVLISPEIYASTKEEKKCARELKQMKYQDETERKIKFRSLSAHLYLVGLFLRSRKWALQSLNDFKKPIMIVYSEGDHFVSKSGIERLEKMSESIDTITLETSYHNPFMSDKGKVLTKKINEFIEK